MSLMVQLAKAENLYAKFVRFNGLVGRDYEDLLLYLTNVIDGLRPKHPIRKDAIRILEEVVHLQGIPGVMYGHREPHTSDSYMSMVFDHKVVRDAAGRWAMTSDMMELGAPLTIDWQKEEDREWELNQEYAEAYSTLVNRGMVRPDLQTES